jgi:hypothetical protein
MTSRLEGSAKVGKGAQVAAHELGGTEGGVLLHLTSGQYHGVDSVGWMIWSLLDGSRTCDEIVEELRRQLPDAPERLSQDTRIFIQGLLDRDLATLIPST